jgi:threonine dehydratase
MTGMITITDIERAYKDVKPYIHKTPLVYSSSLSILSGAEVYLKLENLQKTGSFKVRGAFNKMLHVSNRDVIAASMGNHAQAVAFAAQKLGKRAKIIMPLTASMVKEEATRGYGADVVLVGEQFSEALDFALSQKEFTFLHPFDDELVIAGQGTIGIEIVEDLSGIDAVFVPVGGGGAHRRHRNGRQIQVPPDSGDRRSGCSRTFGVSLLSGKERDRTGSAPLDR